MAGFDPFAMLMGAAGGGAKNSDAGSYAPVLSNSATGNIYMGAGSGSGTAPNSELPVELIAIAGLFLWLMLSKR